MPDSTLALAVLSLALLACGLPGPRPPVAESLRGRVVAETGCEASRVVIQPLGAGGYRVEACGRRTTFSCVRHFRRGVTPDWTDQCTRESPWSAD